MTSTGDKLLNYWQRVLTDGSCEPAPEAEAGQQDMANLDIHELMHTALRVRQGRVPGLLPEQLAGMLISFYQKLTTASRRASFFRVLTEELGVDGKPDLPKVVKEADQLPESE